MEYFREHEVVDAAVDGRMTILPLYRTDWLTPAGSKNVVSPPRNGLPALVNTATDICPNGYCADWDKQDLRHVRRRMLHPDRGAPQSTGMRRACLDCASEWCGNCELCGDCVDWICPNIDHCSNCTQRRWHSLRIVRHVQSASPFAGGMAICDECIDFCAVSDLCGLLDISARTAARCDECVDRILPA